MEFAGIWADLDGEKLIEQIYAERHAAPPSPSYELWDT